MAEDEDYDNKGVGILLPILILTICCSLTLAICLGIGYFIGSSSSGSSVGDDDSLDCFPVIGTPTPVTAEGLTVTGKARTRTLAAKKPAIQSSTWEIYDAERAVDNDYSSQTLDGGTCSGAGGDGSADPFPWWRVDLGAAFVVSKIKFYPRDCCNETYRNINFRVGNVDEQKKGLLTKNTLCAELIGSDRSNTKDPYEISCDHFTVGRYVYIQKFKDPSYLVLCEVEVYGFLFPYIL